MNSTHSLYTGGIPSYGDSWLYDWTAGVWIETSALNEGRMGHGCALLEGHGVLVAGGQNAEGENLYSVELFDPVTGIWTPQPDLPKQIVSPFGPTLLGRTPGSMIALFRDTDKVYQLGGDGTWSALEGVVLPSVFDGRPSDEAILVPHDFATGCM